MSNEALNLVWERSPSQHMARLVLLSIADRANQYGQAFCSAEDLCRRVNGDRTSVFRALATLRQSGELVVEPVKGPGGCNRYLIPMVAEAAGLKRYPGGKLPPHPSQNATGGSGVLHTPASGNMPPKPSSNPPCNPTEREEVMKLEDAIAFFEKEFPDKPVRRSLTKMKLQFRRALTLSGCREWLERERETKKEKATRPITWDEANPAAVQPPAEPAPAQPMEPPASGSSSLSKSEEKIPELEFISPYDIDRERFAIFVAKYYHEQIASWTPYSAPQAVLRQFLKQQEHHR